MLLSLPLAVHISDGVLSLPVVVVGFAITALLVAFAAWRVREDEIPKIALLTAAFFVASSIHVKLGPLTSVHLLLNGLVGVILGRRAPLAILIGVTLQALLIPHGGPSTIGVNACIETIPALLAAGLFAVLARLGERVWVRSLLVGVAALIWGWCVVFGVAVLATTKIGELIHWSRGGVQLRVEELGSAWAITVHPLALVGLVLLAIGCIVAELRANRAPGFPRGALVGMLAVIVTTLLACGVLVAGAAEGWENVVSLVFLAHLPLALIEGLIVGCAVAFLGRVKPEMLGTKPVSQAVAALVAVVALLSFASPVAAHGILVSHTIDRHKREVTLTWQYDDGEKLKKGAKVVVKGSDRTIVAEGGVDEQGKFTFRYEEPDTLTARIEEAGHSEYDTITKEELEGKPVTETRQSGSRWTDLGVGVGLLLALAAFAMAWRNSVRLSRLEALSGRMKDEG